MKDRILDALIEANLLNPDKRETAAKDIYFGDDPGGWGYCRYATAILYTERAIAPFYTPRLIEAWSKASDIMGDGYFDAINGAVVAYYYTAE